MPSEQTSATPQVPIVFMGTPQFAATALEALISHGYHIVGVVTQPDRRSGRKQELMPSAVKVVAEREHIPIFQPDKLDATAVETLAAWKPDLIIVAAYGKILPVSILALPGLGCINIHASLLPRWRGASPVANALLAGDTETGVTLMQLDRGMDTGPLIAKRPTPIGPDEHADALLARLAELGSDLLIETLPLWIDRQITPAAQSTEGVTLSQLIDREDGRVFWTATAEDIYNRFRGLYPWPGIFTFWKQTADDTLRVKLVDISLQRVAPANEYPVGTVLEIGEDIGVQTGCGVIFLRTVQLEGKEPVPIREFLKGYQTFLGSVLL